MIEGLKFALKHELSPKDMEIYILLSEEPDSNKGLARKLKKAKTTVHHTLQRLKLKGVIKMSGTEKGHSIYSPTN